MDTLGTRGAQDTAQTLGSLVTRGALCALDALCTCRTLCALNTLLTLYTCPTRYTLKPTGTLDTLDTLRTRRTTSSLCARLTLEALWALWALRTRISLSACPSSGAVDGVEIDVKYGCAQRREDTTNIGYVFKDKSTTITVIGGHLCGETGISVVRRYDRN